MLESVFREQMGRFHGMSIFIHNLTLLTHLQQSYFQKMTVIFSSQPFYGHYVRLSTADDPVPSNISENRKLWPFFQGCLGAIDGSHIHITPPAALVQLYQNRKGFLSQNCLFACSFELLFTFAFTGWEGSAADARVWADALLTGFTVPQGFYYLADAGFPHCEQLLVPYCNVQYHLQEWGAARVRYVTFT